MANFVQFILQHPVYKYNEENISKASLFRSQHCCRFYSTFALLSLTHLWLTSAQRFTTVFTRTTQC